MPESTITLNSATIKKPAACFLVLEPLQEMEGISPTILLPGSSTIGSSPESGIPLDLPGIAARHGIFVTTPRQTVFYAEDSRTWLNEGPVSKSLLRAGDRLAIGPLEFRLREVLEHELPDEFSKVMAEDSVVPKPVEQPSISVKTDS